MAMLGALLCRAGRHDPMAGGVWNGGYCFTACARCGRDMVRSVFGEWHVPRDFRIVWRMPGQSTPDIDAIMQARDGSSAGEAIGPVEPSPAVAVRPARPILRTARERSPFDFADFDDAEGPEPSDTPAPGARRSRAS